MDDLITNWLVVEIKFDKSVSHRIGGDIQKILYELQEKLNKLTDYAQVSISQHKSDPLLRKDNHKARPGKPKLFLKNE